MTYLALTKDNEVESLDMVQVVKSTPTKEVSTLSYVNTQIAVLKGKLQEFEALKLGVTKEAEKVILKEPEVEKEIL